MHAEIGTFVTGDLIASEKLAIGDGYRAKNAELSTVGIPFARAGNIDNGFQFNGADNFPEEDLWKVGEKISRPGDVVFTSKGTVGRFAFVSDETPRFVYSPQLCYWRSLDADIIDPMFLYYWMNGREFWKQAAAVKGDTDMADYVSLTEQRRIKITLPSIDAQREISKILGTLDDKIELNRRMNHTLEAMAQSIFKSWFVDFNPVTAKADGRQPYGMNADTVALFPSHYTESELGPIPEAWTISSIAELAQYVNGKNFTKNATGFGRMVIRIKELNSGQAASTVFNEVDASKQNIAYPGDLLFSWSGSLNVYRWHQDEALVNQHIFKVIPQGLPQWFVYFQLREAISFFQGIAADKATTMGHIKREHLSQAKLALPPPELISAMDSVVEPLYQRFHQNERESITLASIRDTLLPKLLSGEIRVKDAENQAEAIT